jgi:hypothetical protein
MSAESLGSPIVGDLSTEESVQREGATIWFRIHGLLERMHQMLTRRHSSDRGPDPDYAAGLQDLESLEKLIRIARESRDVHVNNSKGNGGNHSWPNKLVLGVCVILAASGIIGAIVTYAQVASVTTEIHSYIISNNQRLDSDEGRIRDTERRLDRGATTP